MSIVTVAQFKIYAKLGDSDTGGELQYQEFLDAAEAIVAEYLGYAPAAASLTQTYFGDGKPYINLRAPVNGSVTSITIDGVAQTVGDWLVDFERITNKYGNPLGVGSLAVVAYSGGFATIPALITLVIKRIATLMSMETGERIGVSSQSFDGGNTRSFINYTNYAKYLASLASLRVDRIERKAP